MMLPSRRHTATTTAAPLLAASDTDGYTLRIRNTSMTVTAYLGDHTVSAAAGFPLGPGAELELQGVTADSPPYAVTAVGTAELAILARDYDRP